MSDVNANLSAIIILFMLTWLISLLVMYVVVRLAVSHGVSKRVMVAQQRAQTALLIGIAQRQGVDATLVDWAHKESQA